LSSTLVFRLTVTDPEDLRASDQCSVGVNGAASVMNNATFNVVLAGQWISLSRTVKRSFITLRGKIRVNNLGSQTAPSSVLYVYQSSDPALQETD